MTLTFVVSTQKDRGKHAAKSSATVNAHSARFGWDNRVRKGRFRLEGETSKATNKTPKDTLSAAKSHGDEPVARSRVPSGEAKPRGNAKQQYYDISSSGLRRACSVSLDPFLRLPFEASTEEKSLLQFYLTEGRRYAYGTAAKPAFCPALYSACRLLSVCDVYVYSHLCVAEAMLCQLNGQNLSPGFYLRRAKAYRAMNNFLGTSHQPILRQVQGLTTLITLEYITGQTSLLEKHTHAMSNLIEHSGWLQNIELHRPGRRRVYAFNLSFWIDHLLYSSPPAMNSMKLEYTLSQFRITLADMQRWTDQMQLNLKKNANSSISYVEQSNSKRWTLNLYIDSIIHQCFSCPLDLSDINCEYSQISGSFHFLFALIISQVVYNYTAAQSVNFLERTNTAIEESAATNTHGATRRHPKHTNPVAASFSLGHVRSTSTMCPMDDEKELELCRASLTVMRLLPLFNKEKRLELAEYFRQCAFVAVRCLDTGLACCVDGVDFYEELCHEVRQNWALRELEGFR